MEVTGRNLYLRLIQICQRTLILLNFFLLPPLLSLWLFCRISQQTRWSPNFSNPLQITRSNSQISLRFHSTSLEPISYCLHCLVPKLIPVKLNRTNQNLVFLLQDDTTLSQQLWEHRLKTPKPLFLDQIGFKTIRKFLHRNGKRITFNVANSFEGPNVIRIHTTS